MRLSPLIALAMLCTFGCTLNRAPIIEGSDAGSLLDVPLPPGPDVPTMELDTPTGCPASCAVGERCEEGICVCASDLCAGDRACIAGACTVCGGVGETCCPDLACRDGRECEGGRCPASRCDTIGDTCCDGDRCDGLACRGGSCIAACGANNQGCCPSGAQCDTSLSCRISWDLSERCQSCGGFAEPCCPPGDSCEGSMGCTAGRCF